MISLSSKSLLTLLVAVPEWQFEVCFFLDPGPGAAAWGAGSSATHPGRRAEESRGQAVGLNQGEDGPRCQCYHTWETASWTQESQRVPKKQGALISRFYYIYKCPLSLPAWMSECPEWQLPYWLQMWLHFAFILGVCWYNQKQNRFPYNGVNGS